MMSPAELKRPPLNRIDPRSEKAICADDVKPCGKCGAMPIGVELVSETADPDYSVTFFSESEDGCVIIECPNGCLKVITETPESAIGLWNNGAPV